MRLLAAAAAAAALLAGCVAPRARPATDEAAKAAGYNRREMPPATPGVFTGRDGTWTVYRNEADRVEREETPPPRRRTTLSCQRGQVCDPPAEAEAE